MSTDALPDEAEFEPYSIPEHNFTMIANAILRTANLTFQAKGVLANMLSHREDYPITLDLLVSQGKDGKTAVNNAIDELIAAGYIKRGERMRRPAGSKNKAGKDISGTLGAYRYRFTTEAKQVAQWHKQYIEENPGQDHSRKPAQVVTRDDSGRFAPGTTAENRHWSPPAETDETAAQNQRRETNVVNRHALEDQEKKTKREENQTDTGSDVPPPPPVDEPEEPDCLSEENPSEEEHAVGARLLREASASWPKPFGGHAVKKFAPLVAELVDEHGEARTLNRLVQLGTEGNPRNPAGQLYTALVDVASSRAAKKASPSGDDAQQRPERLVPDATAFINEHGEINVKRMIVMDDVVLVVRSTDERGVITRCISNLTHQDVVVRARAFTEAA